MPIYMDRHDIPGVTINDAAAAHLQDLDIQCEYNCKAMTYWVDEERGNAFCLIDAPNKEAVVELHKKAHGLIPHEIIEVNSNLVKSFLGRINDVEDNIDSKTNLVTDSAFRILMVIETSKYIDRIEDNQFDLFYQKFYNSTNKLIEKFNGTVVLLKSNSYLISFNSVTNAIFCALKLQANIKYITPNFNQSYRRLKIGLSSGIPVTEKENLFEEAINLATYFCEVVDGQIVISNEVKRLYENVNHNSFINKEHIRTLSPNEEQFLKKLMLFVENNWDNPAFNVSEFSAKIGLSKSQLNRKLKALTNKTPNNFIREFRLQRALKLLYYQKGNISEIAFASGFNSPAYFSKCFFETYGVLPSKYIQQHIN